MSKAEVIEAVSAMSREDREFVAAFLRARNLAEDPDFRDENSRRLKEMKAGRGHSSQDVRELHQALEDKGL